MFVQTIKISVDYSNTPGPRLKTEGKYSGEDFRETVLKPKFELAIQSKEKILVNLDGGYGYPPSFLEEAFGGLAREYDERVVQETFEFISEDEPSLIEEIRGYIKNARQQRKIGESNENNN